MRKLAKYVSGLLKVQIIKIDPMLRMWIFGIVILITSIFTNAKLIPFILVFMIILSISYRKSIEGNLKKDIGYLNDELEILDENLEIGKDHLEKNEATLDERILMREMEKEREELENLLLQVTDKLEEIERQNKNFKNFLVKIKKASKMFITGKKENK